MPSCSYFHKNMITYIKNDNVTRTIYKIVTFKDQDERIDHMAIYYMQCVTTYSYSVVVVIIFSM